MLCWPRVTDDWQLQLSLCCLQFLYCISPWPCPLYPSFPAAFCPLNQSRGRFREEVNTLVLWLGPFLQRGLCNWKALGDYFKTLVGTGSHVCAMAGNGALSLSCSCVRWLLNNYGVFSLFSSMITVLYWIYRKSNKSSKQISAVSPRLWSVTHKQQWDVSQSRKRKKRELHCHNWLCVFQQVSLRPSVLHTALQNPDHQHPANQN